MVTWTSRPRVFSGTGTLTMTSARVWVHAYFPGTIPPLPSGGGPSPSSSLSLLLSFDSFFLSPSLVAAFVAAGGISSTFCDSLAEVVLVLALALALLLFSGVMIGFLLSTVVEASNPPSLLISIISSSLSGSSFLKGCVVVFVAVFVFDAAFAFVFFRACFVFFFFSAASLSFLYRSACFCKTSLTLAMAAAVPSSEPGGPEKKSVFRRRKEKTLSNSGSMPRAVWATFK
mmetsp:Transcript_4889/g.10004  ORF Transcript_4889/g.10004 Transcript_4889/m.10004 type:complete len:230 (-) Transcript_4889:131-820(-)